MNMYIENEIRHVVENKKAGIEKQTKEADLLVEIGATLLVILPVALPVSLSLLAGGFIYNALEENKNLNKTAMPEEWPIKVSESNEVSKKGLHYLANKAEKKGFVSVKEAIAFLEVEKNEEAKKNIKREEKITSEGIRKLLEKDKDNSLLNSLFTGSKDALSALHSNVSKASQQSKDLSDLFLKKINPFKK